MSGATSPVRMAGVVLVMALLLPGCYRVAPGTYGLAQPYSDVAGPAVAQGSAVVIGSLTIRGAHQVAPLLGGQHIPNICSLVNTREGKTAILGEGYFFKEVDRPGPHAIRCGIRSPYLNASVRDLAAFDIPPDVVVNVGSIRVDIGPAYPGGGFPITYQRSVSAAPLGALRTQHPGVYEAYRGRMLDVQPR